MIDYVEIRNADRELIGIIDDAESIIWETAYYSTGRFEIYVRVTKQTVALLVDGNYVTRPNDRNIGIIENLHIGWTPQTGLMIVASGRFAKSLLDRRLIHSYGNNYRAKQMVLNGTVEFAVRMMLVSNIIAAFDKARNIPFIQLGEMKHIDKVILDEEGNPGSIQVGFENLLDYSDKLLQEYSLGAYMTLDKQTKRLLYHVYEGADRSVGNTAGNEPLIFSQEFDNLLSTDYKRQTSAHKTTALIAGEGEGADQFFTVTGHYSAGLNRREVFVDASSLSRTYTEETEGDGGVTVETEKTYTQAEYAALLKAEGQKDLAQRKIIETFDGMVDVMNTEKIFGKDYWVGDIITIQDKQMGKYINARILTATEVQDANGYKLAISYGA